ncbi:cation transporter, partial [bacterium]|nr:cation transporter [bacterium]
MTTKPPVRPLPAPDASRPGEGMAKLQLKVGGMHCSLCTDSIRKSVGRLDGVQSVQVSIAHEEALVEYDPRRVEPLEIQEALEDIGYTVRPPDQAGIFEEEERELAGARRKAFLSIGLLVAASALMATTVIRGPSLYQTLPMMALALYTALEQLMKQGQGTPFPQRFQTLAPVIDQVYDLDTVLRVSVGARWATLDETARKALSTAFRDFTIAT